jgi:hypothetical protein
LILGLSIVNFETLAAAICWLGFSGSVSSTPNGAVMPVLTMVATMARLAPGLSRRGGGTSLCRNARSSKHGS